MNIRSSVLSFCIAIILAVILVIWFGKRQPQSPAHPLAESAVEQTNAPAGVAQKPANQIARTNTNEAIISTNGYKAAPSGPSKVEMLKMIFQANSTDIVFYGRLEDQFGNPVPDANVNFSIGYEDLSGTGERRGQTTSDLNGFFTISGYKGADLGITPENAGYTLATTSTYFKYSKHNFVPDANNPTIIKMWKFQGGERLIHFQTQARALIDGSPIAFNLQTGQEVQSGGDIIISVETTSMPNVRQRYNWEAKLRAVDGGLISSKEDFDKMFAAPNSGYEPEFIVAYQKDIMPWTTTFNNAFYLSSRNGKCYGIIGVEILSDVVKNRSVPVILNSYVNAAGSRNLEIDPSKVTEAHP